MTIQVNLVPNPSGGGNAAISWPLPGISHLFFILAFFGAALFFYSMAVWVQIFITGMFVNCLDILDTHLDSTNGVIPTCCYCAYSLLPLCLVECACHRVRLATMAGHWRRFS